MRFTTPARYICGCSTVVIVGEKAFVVVLLEPGIEGASRVIVDKRVRPRGPAGPGVFSTEDVPEVASLLERAKAFLN